MDRKEQGNFPVYSLPGLWSIVFTPSLYKARGISPLSPAYCQEREVLALGNVRRSRLGQLQGLEWHLCDSNESFHPKSN